MKFKVNDKVKLKNDYDGYFKDFKGQVLTVSETFLGNDVPSHVEALKIKEFNTVEKYHLLGIDNFDHVNELDVLKSMDKLIIGVIK
jgi:hypothetical protein